MANSYLGEYIHHKLENYQLLGLNRKRGEEGYSWQSDVESSAQNNYEKLKKYIDNHKTTDLAEKLSYELTSLLYPNATTWDSSKYTEEQRNAIIQTVKEYLPKYTDEELGDDLGVYQKVRGKMTNQLKKLESGKTGKHQQGYLEGIANAFYGFMNKPDIQRSTKLYDQINKAYQILTNELYEAQNISDTKMIYLGMSGKDSAKMDIINTAIMALNDTVKIDTGIFGEAGLGALMGLILGFIQDEPQRWGENAVKSFVDKVRVGDITVTADNTSISGAVAEKLKDIIKAPENRDINWSITDENKRNYKLTASKSQQTVDLEIIGGSYEGKDVDIRASIKNYAGTHGGVHIITGTNMLAMFNLMDTAYINHYINLIIQHPELKNPKTADYFDPHFKLATAIRAISGQRGGDYGGALSDYLVINDRQAKKVRVISTEGLLGSLSNLNTISNYVSWNGNNKPPEAGKIKNDLYPDKDSPPSFADAASRIAKILVQFAKINLSMSITSKAFYGPQGSTII